LHFPTVKLDAGTMDRIKWWFTMVPRPQIWQRWQRELFPNLSAVHQQRDFGVPTDTSKAQRGTS